MAAAARLIRTSILGLAARGGSLLAGVLIGALLGRLLGPSGYGVYAASFALVSLIGIPLQLGLPTLVLRQVAVYAQREEWSLLRGILSWAYRLILLLSVVIAALALAAYELIPGVGFTWTPTMTAAAFLAPLIACNRVREATLQGLRRVAWAQLPDQVLTPLAYLGCLVVLGLVLPRPVPPQVPMTAYALCALGALIFGTALLAHFMPGQVRTAAPEFRSRDWLRGILPLCLVSGFGLVNGQIDLLLLSLLSGSNNAGLFRAAFTAAGLTSVVGATIGNLMSSHYAVLYTQADHVRLQKLVRYSAWAAFLPAVCVFCAYAFAGATILGAIFGREFAAASTALILLGVGQVINCAAGVVQSLLNMTGHANDTLKGVIAGALVNIMLNILLVPRFGATGAAAATSMGIIIENTICCVLAWRRVRINTTVLPLFWSAARA